MGWHLHKHYVETPSLKTYQFWDVKHPAAADFLIGCSKYDFDSRKNVQDKNFISKYEKRICDAWLAVVNGFLLPRWLL